MFQKYSEQVLKHKRGMNMGVAKTVDLLKIMTMLCIIAAAIVIIITQLDLISADTTYCYFCENKGVIQSNYVPGYGWSEVDFFIDCPECDIYDFDGKLRARDLWPYKK